MKSASLLTTLLFFTVGAFAQTVITEAQYKTVRKKLAVEKDPVKRIDLLHLTARYYLEKDSELKKYVDSAALCNKQANDISRKLGLKKRIVKSMLLDGHIAVKRNKDSLGFQIKNKALHYARKHGLKKEEADVYKSLGNDYCNAADIPKYVACFNKAVQLYNKAGAFYEQAETHALWARGYQIDDLLELSTQQAKLAIAIKKQIKRPNIHTELYCIAYNLQLQGNLDQAQLYLLESPKNCGSTGRCGLGNDY
ncbi:hypothetical protein [Flavobacterium sp.]|uniref:hypothetical protein n=1 Tax=Flavobacterium sp. TaxID=239 RepID=UPI0039E67975